MMQRTLLVAAVVAAALSLSVAELAAQPSSGAEAGPTAPRFGPLSEDPAPAELIRNSHYWVSNENAHDIWRSRIRDLGGVQLAVGADQVYVLAGWSRPEVLVPLDFDTAIRDLHRVYGALFLAAPTRDAFVRLWSAGSADEVATALTRTWGEQEGARLLGTWRECHARVARRFQRMTSRYARAGVPIFLTDDATYTFLRQLWSDGRVVPVRGDVTGDRALRSVAAAASASSLPVRLVYLSNVEQYITYGPSFRRNVLALPMDERSVVLRTRSMESLGFAEEGDEYHYNMQSGQNFQAWMRVNRVSEGRFLLRERSSSGRPGLSEITREPPVSTPAPQIAN